MSAGRGGQKDALCVLSHGVGEGALTHSAVKGFHDDRLPPVSDLKAPDVSVLSDAADVDEAEDGDGCSARL